MAHMDRISHLPEELLLKILSLLPLKDVVVTMVLSKRWQFLWMLVPRLEYDHDMYQDGEDKRFSRFVYSSLLLHEAPVLESLRFKLDWKSSAIDIGVWVRTAVKRCVRELDIEIHSPSVVNPVILPWSLYNAGCRMLVTLKLSNTILVDASSSPASFPCLKNLSLVDMKYPSEEFVNEFLSSCPVLEDLVVEQCRDDNVTVLAVKIPSLKKLSLCKSTDVDEDKGSGFVIEAPLLESFDILDHSYCGGFCYMMENMPEIVYANVDINYWILWKILGFITSVKRLYLCLSTLKVISC